MASLDFNTIGDRQKTFEQVDAGRAIMPGIPVLARLDGKGFHNFTKGLKRPFDVNMTFCMQETAKYLLEESNAKIAYTQSDEITLCWPNLEDAETKIFFGGKFQKLTSVLAAKASVRFNMLCFHHLPETHWDKEPVFDCRVWQVPSLKVAAENFLWREMDARKNAVSMAASDVFSPKELHGVSTYDRIGMLKGKGIIFDEFPRFFKTGSYFKRVQRLVLLNEQELAAIPEQYRPTGPVTRTVVSDVFFPKLTSISNLPEVLFSDEEPVPHSLMVEENEPS